MLLKQLHEAKQAPRTYIQVQAGRKVAVGAARALSPQICNLTDPPDQPAAAAETLRAALQPSPSTFTTPLSAAAAPPPTAAITSSPHQGYPTKVSTSYPNILIMSWTYPILNAR